MRWSPSARPAPTSPSRCSASCRRRWATPAIRACSSRSSPTSPSRSGSPRSRNGRSATCPTRSEMYATLFKWLKATKPDLKTIYGGVEEDFAHSRATWYAVMKEVAAKEGFEVQGRVEVAARTTPTSPTRRARPRRPDADIVAIAAHPFTTCGMLKEMERQGVKPKLLIGPHLVLEHGDAAGLRRRGRGHHHPDQLRAGQRSGAGCGRARSPSSTAASTCTPARPGRTSSSSSRSSRSRR